MAVILDNFKIFFRQKNIFAKLIIINVLVFVIIRLVAVIFTLFKLGDWSLLQYLELPASFSQLAMKPWTVITYMFVHYEFLHILFNMLWLYWFGQIFISFFNEKQLFGVYLIGGICGAIFFILAYNIFPYFEDKMEQSALIGASAAVMAIVFAASFYKKDFRINLLFIGSIKIYYIALASLLIDMLAVTSLNAGGHIAHIGGALFGIGYASAFRKGKDLTAPLNKCIDWFVDLFKKKPKMQVKYQRRESDYEYNDRRNKNTQEIDLILDKIKKSGYESLTKEEKKRLFDAGK